MKIKFYPISGGDVVSPPTSYLHRINLSGGRIKKDSENDAKLNVKGLSTVENLPNNKPVMHHDCIGGLSVGSVDDKYRYFIPSNEKELARVKLVANDLIEKNIIFVEELELPDDLPTIKKRIKQSFYNADSTLKNEKFKNNLSPDRMAEIGLEFCGNELKDRVRCHFNHGHGLHNWEEKDEPILELEKFHRQKGTSPIPCLFRDYKALYSDTGEDVTGKKYKITDGNPGERSSTAYFLTHKDFPLELIDPQELWSTVDSCRLEDVEKSLNTLEKNRKVNQSYKQLVKESLFLKLFSKLVNGFNQTKKHYIKELDNYNSKLPTEMDDLLKSLSSCNIEEEVNNIIEKIAELEMIKCHLKLLNNIPPTVYGIKPAEKIIKDEYNKLGLYDPQRKYSSDFFNTLVNTNVLCDSFKPSYFKTNKDQESNILLYKLGTNLKEYLNEISAKIKELINRNNISYFE